MENIGDKYSEAEAKSRTAIENHSPNPEMYFLQLDNMSLQERNDELQDMKAVVEAKVENYERVEALLAGYEAYQVEKQNYQQMRNKLPVVATSEYQTNPTHNQTHRLNDKQGRSLWIFKPIGIGYNDARVAIAEHTASLFNYERKFPIPLTLMVELGGVTGSAQIFINDAKSVDDIKVDKDHDISLENQRLIIFDLLTANGDRHMDNFLRREEEQVICTYGIDHDRCFMLKQIKPLKLDYGEFGKQSIPFEPVIESLVSDEAVEHYIRAVVSHGENSEWVSWVKIVAEAVKEAIFNRTHIQNLIATLEKTLKEMYQVG